MKLIVGLGNPGTQYARTRHNVGFAVVDRVMARFGAGEPAKARFQGVTNEVSIGDEKCLMLKPTTFMNRSGQSVAEAARFYRLDAAQDLLVIVDDFYLPTGALRMRPGGSAGGHNGLTDIQEKLGRDDYPRLRVGVGQQPSGGKPSFMDQADFVLSRFSADEEELLAPAIAKAAEAVEVFARKGLSHAMNFANAGPAREKPRTPGPDPQPPTDRPQAPPGA